MSLAASKQLKALRHRLVLKCRPIGGRGGIGIKAYA
jgi:hypothetical protein